MTGVPVTKQRYVYVALREEIQTGALLPGDSLTVTGLAERFDVSSIPVREALRQLEQEGLVEMKPHVHVRVKGVSVEEALWSGELRLVLEPLAARNGTPHVTSDVLDELHALLADMDSQAAASDFAGFMLSNRRFHDVIYGLDPNKTLVRIIDELWDVSQRFQNVFRQEGHLEASRVDHFEMVEGLRRRDADAVEAVVRRHRMRILETLRKWAKPRLARLETESV